MVNRGEEVYTHVTMLLSPQRTTRKHVICATRSHYGTSHERIVSRGLLKNSYSFAKTVYGYVVN